MVAAAWVPFNCLPSDIAAGVHANAFNADTDTLKVYLTNTAPNAATHALKADLAEIANGNGYAAPVDIQNAATKTGAVITMTATDLTITASGGSVGPFRYAVVYNDTTADKVDPLLGYYDYGSAITLGDGESITVDFGATFLTL